MSVRILGLLLLLGCALGVWWQRGQSYTTCTQPLPYRPGQVDERFGLSHSDVLEAIQRAEQLWETALGENLFEYDPTARLSINLLFDERQQTALAGRRLANKLQQTASSHATLAESYAYWHQVLTEKTRAYDSVLADYNTRAEEYQANAQRWNTPGGAPRRVYADLENERQQLQTLQQQLDSDRGYIRSLVDTVNTLADRGKTLTTTYNRQVKTYKNLYGENRRFHKGEYNGKAITIYQFHNLDDLTLVLVHELGHALGVEHVNNPEAVMHDFIGEQELEPVALTPEDVRALRTACHDR